LITKHKKENQFEKAKKALHKNKVAAPSKQEQEADAGLIVQCLIRGIVARKQIVAMRNAESYFLGMDRPEMENKLKKKRSPWDEPIEYMEMQQEVRRQQRIEVAYNFEKEKKKLEEEIMQVEAADIIEEER
jgi:hypothetical protein